MNRVLWLIYKRLRPAIGTSFAFIFMYMAFTNNMSSSLFFTAFGFMLIHLFGDCFNDYYDIEEDKKNKRSEKLILSGVLTPTELYSLSIIFLIAGLGLVAFFNAYLLFPALWYSLLLYAYSHHSIRLKQYNLSAYLLGGSVWIVTFILMDIGVSGKISSFGVIFSLFSFSQFVYILCQKDTTDINDRTNLYLSRGWKNSFFITAFFGALASLSLLLLSFSSILLVIFWIFNASTKLDLLSKIRRNTITRADRSTLVLMEFLMPYLYVGGVLLV